MTFILGILLALALSVLTISGEQLAREKYDLFEYFMSVDPGFSSPAHLAESGYENFRFEKIWLIASSIPKIIRYKMAGGNNKNLERIDIDIKFLDYQKILADRERMLKIGMLSEPSTVKANITSSERTHKAKIRLKGDLMGHWLSKYRMSFRVRLKGANTILGYKKFSTQKPSQRYHPYDYTFQSMMRKVGNLSAPHSYVNLHVNGADWGIMDVEEHMSKEFLEKQNRKESIIVRFSNEKSWLYKNRAEDPYPYYRISVPSLYVRLYNSGKYLKNDHYRKMYSYILKQNLNYNPNLFDTDHLTKAFILATAWGSWHTLQNNNARYYFNPFTLNLEIITTDQDEFRPIHLKSMDNLTPIPPHHLNLMSTQQYIDNFYGNLDSVGEVLSDIQSHLDHAHSFFPLDRKLDGKTVMDGMGEVMARANYFLNFPLEKIGKDSQSPLNMPTTKQAPQFDEHLHVRHFTDGHLELYNLLPDTVSVRDILFNGKSILDNKITVPSYLSGSSPILLTTQHLGIQDNNFILETEYKGSVRQVKNEITLFSGQIKNPLLLDTSQDNGFLTRLENGSYEVKNGSWVIHKSVVVGSDLYIPPGVSMKFSKNAYLIVKGALTAIGDIKNPVVLEPLLDSWKGIYVLNAGKRSRLTNIKIKNITALEDGLLKLTGGVTFYKSDVDLENVMIDNVEAEDALHIFDSDFTMKSVQISNTVSDGLDSDFSRGTVSESTFLEVGGDALDFSGSTVEIEGVIATNIKDKAVSAGEKSIINIYNSTFNNIGVGIAAKDGSNVFASNVSMSNYGLHAAMSYVKKDFYGVPGIRLVDCKADQDNPYVRQKGTNMIVDNLEVQETEVNVGSLYQNRVMKK